MPAIALIFFAAGVPALGQEPIQVEVRVVNVFCTVRDKNGALVTNLGKNNFEISEDGKPQEIRYFARETDLPLTIGLLVDVSGSVRRFVQAEKGTAESFLKEIMRPQDQGLLVGFSSTIVLWQDFTASPAAILRTLETLHPVPFRGLPTDGGPMPSTLLYDAVSSTAVHQFERVSGRKAMLVISDGVDIGSRHTLEDCVRAVQSANVIVYGICYENLRVPGCSYLKSLSEPTGGRMFPITPAAPLSRIFDVIQQELRSQYSLGYVSTNTARDRTFRKLKVDVRPKGFKIEARKGYYASVEN